MGFAKGLYPSYGTFLARQIDLTGKSSVRSKKPVKPVAENIPLSRQVESGVIR
jgi:hypothetical protein